MNGTCTNIWQVDDFASCARHKYLERYIPITLLAISITLFTYKTVNSFFNKNSSSLQLKPSLENEPLLSFTQQNYDTLSCADDDNSKLSISETHFDIRYIKPVTADGKPIGNLKVVFRSFKDRLLLAFQELLLAFQLAISLFPFFLPDFKKEWFSYSTPLANLAFWLYIFVITTLRLFYSSKGLSEKFPNLWYHTFNLCLLNWFASFLLFRSALLDHVANDYSKYYYISEFAINTLLVCIQGSDAFSDRPVIIYEQKGLIASPEPKSSFFSVTCFSWVNDMISHARKSATTMSDIWCLKLQDNAYPVLLKFHKTKWHKRFTVNLFYQFRMLFFWQSLMTSAEAVLTFFPSMLLKQILEYVESPSTESASLAWLFVILMFISGPIAAALSGRELFIGRRICTRMRAVIIGEVYTKALKRRLNESDKAEEEKEASNDGKDKSTNDSTGANIDINTNDHNTATENKEKKSESKSRDLGSIINLIAVDAFKVSEICGYLHYFVNSFVMTILCIVLLYNLLGWAALVGAATIVLMMPINYKMSMLLGKYQKDMLKITDKRIQKLNETFQNIRIIKYFAWENKFAEQILEIREEELRFLFKRCITWILASFVWFITPTTVCLVAFYCYTVVQGKPLTTPIAFTSLSLFNLLRNPLDQFADMLSFVVQSKVSLDRIEDFLNEPESSKYEQLSMKRSPNSPLVGFENATFSWCQLSKNDFRLRDININFKIGKLNVIVGPTGAGKSSLLSALLGEMDLVEGKVFLPGVTARDDLIPSPVTGLTESVAYCSQTAWLLNGTIKENILFASQFEEERYRAVVNACGLKRDFEILAAGDSTEIGEKGITLSGGQKQRVSLARALYSKSAYVLLDDCLSAVDSHTAIHIYENCITGHLMNNRTCILVSHNISLTIKEADHVIIMENGRVKNQGDVDSLLKENAFDIDTTSSVLQSRSASTANLNDLDTSEFQAAQHAHILDSTYAALASDMNADQMEIEPETDDTKIDRTGKLVEEETKSEGTVSWSVYKTYIDLFGNPVIWTTLSIVFMATQGVNIYQSWWLRVWSLAENERAGINSVIGPSYHSSIGGTLSIGWNSGLDFLKSVSWNKPLFPSRFSLIYVENLSVTHSSMYYIAIYTLIGFVYSCLGSIRIILTFFGGLNVSRKIFKMLLMKVLRAEVRFFDSTPIGRIMNRFSKDMEGIDQELAPYAEAFAISAISCVSIVILISSITPAFILLGVLVSIAFAYVGVLYLTLSRELKRFESITRSPINQHFTETLVGVTTIRAYGDERRFLVENMQKIDTNNRPFFYIWVNNRWMSFRAYVVGSLVVVFSAALAVLSAKHIDAGLAGMSLSFASSFSVNALWLLRTYADVEININAVERVQEYIDETVQEPAPEIPENDPPASWPEHGEIEVKDLALRYAANLPQVIKGISFHVRAGEKVGVVGRTGAGKSTIITSFFRFIEPDSGTINIDGVDIGKIGLNRLRRGLTIIPQDPTLFTGSLRSNLDLFDEYSDLEIFESLKRVDLISREEYNKLSCLVNSGQIAAIENDYSEENANKFLNLESEITENGGNLSQGERQLVCLARSLLRHPKILMLDEATASIDYETDSKIQTTIREEFSESTILTIAHRLKTIIDYDKILVLDQGNVKEYDHPYTLITNAKSQFRSMCMDTGEFDELVKLAKEAYEDDKK